VNADTPEGSPILDTFSRSERSEWVVAISIPVDELTGALHRWLWFSVAGAGVAFLLALFLARHISLRIARSVGAMSDAALALAWGDPIVIPPVEIKEVAEVGRALAEAWRLLQERTTSQKQAEGQVREHQAELAHFSRVSLAGEMAAGMAHELSQPLTAIVAYGRGCLRLLAKPTLDPGLLKEGVQEVVQQAERAGDVLVRLRDSVRRDVSRRRFVAVRPLIQAAVALAATEAMQSQVDVVVRADPDLPLVLADNIEIEQVLLNLLLNAIDAMVVAETQRRSIVVEARRKGGDAVEISVADTGPGISDELKDKIFESFVTTKPRGMGMGLSISRHIIEAHGGSLRVLCNGNVGATFTFELPTTVSEGNSNNA
jgi:C4-dicarboxylate-specific signal transduction histidine kinase